MSRVGPPAPPDFVEGAETYSRAQIDRSCRGPVLWFFGSSVFWLLAGTALALLASIKLHTPWFLADAEWLTFGRVRPAHLNTMIYGWAGMVGIGALLWMQARLAKVPIILPRTLSLIAVAWNVVTAIGTVAILLGEGTSVEWLEFPYRLSFALAGLFALVGIVSMGIFFRRRERHVYVSQWYMFGAIVWFPFLYIIANFLIHGGAATGAAQGAANWWFAHNVLGLWLTPIGVATAYYLIPKVIGRPIHSYYLSIVGFWALALFYNWAGSHHLLGGPLPAWVLTLGVVGSVMMFIPVTAVAINHHMTMVGHFRKLKFSPTLRFIVFGAMSYTAVSIQGSLTALRTINETTHFTHYTIAHAHLGVYSFFTMSMFAAVYYITPRLTGREWSSARLIKIHFWTVGVGMAIYWIGLSAGGVIQGMQMNDPAIPFMEVVTATVPWLFSRSVAGTLMAIGHVAFGVLVWNMLTGKGRRTGEPTRLAQGDGAESDRTEARA